MWINRVTERNNYKILKLMKIYIKMKIAEARKWRMKVVFGQAPLINLWIAFGS